MIIYINFSNISFSLRKYVNIFINRCDIYLVFYDVEDEFDFMEEYILVLHISIYGSVFSVSFMEKSLSCIM